MTCVSCANLLTTYPNFDRIGKFLTCGSSPSSIANPGYEQNQTPSFWSFILCPIKSPSFQKLLMTSLHDLRFSPPPNSKSRLRLCIKPCAICIPDTSRCILVIVDAPSRAVAYNIPNVQSNKIFVALLPV